MYVCIIIISAINVSGFFPSKPFEVGPLSETCYSKMFIFNENYFYMDFLNYHCTTEYMQIYTVYVYMYMHLIRRVCIDTTNTVR